MRLPPVAFPITPPSGLETFECASRELQEQGRDRLRSGPPSVQMVATDTGAGAAGQDQHLTDFMVAAGVDPDFVSYHVRAGAGEGHFFLDTLRAQDAALLEIEESVLAGRHSTTSSLYSTVQLQAAGLEEENEALAEKVAGLEAQASALAAGLDEMSRKSALLEKENARLTHACRALEESNKAREDDFRRDADALQAEIDFMRAASRAQKQELEMERTRMEQKLHQGKKDAHDEVQQQRLHSSDIEKRAQEGLRYKRNYDTIYAQSQMLQERVWGLEKDLLESQMKQAPEDVLLQSEYYRDEVAQMTAELIRIQTDAEEGKSKLNEVLNETRRQLEAEQEKNQTLTQFQAQCERVSGIDMSKLCSVQELTLTQQMLLIEAERSIHGKYLAIWMARHRRKTGTRRARQWLAARRDRKQEMMALQCMQHHARRSKKLKKTLRALQRRKSRSIQLTIVTQWGRVVRLVRAFNTAAKSILERSDLVLVGDVLRQWQQLIGKQRMADEHGKSAGLRSTLQAATAAMSQLEAQDFQSFLPTVAPGVYGRNVEAETTAKHRLWHIIVASVRTSFQMPALCYAFLSHTSNVNLTKQQKERKRVKKVKLSSMVWWRWEVVASQRSERICQRRIRRLRKSAMMDWLENVQKSKQLKRACLNMLTRSDGAILKSTFLEVNNSTCSNQNSWSSASDGTVWEPIYRSHTSRMVLIQLCFDTVETELGLEHGDGTRIGIKSSHDKEGTSCPAYFKIRSDCDESSELISCFSALPRDVRRHHKLFCRLGCKGTSTERSLPSLQKRKSGSYQAKFPLPCRSSGTSTARWTS